MPSKRLYIRGIPESVGEEQIRKHLSIYGEIIEVKILDGYCFVEFTSEKDALDVVDTFSQQAFLGFYITIEFAHPLRKDRRSLESGLTAESAPRSKSKSRLPPRHAQLRYPVVVTNLPRGLAWQELKDFGRSTGVLVAFCDVDKRGKGRGFIEYFSQDDADHAVRSLNGQTLGDNVVKVFSRDVTPSKSRPAKQNRSRSRSPTRRHTHSHSSQPRDMPFPKLSARLDPLSIPPAHSQRRYSRSRSPVRYSHHRPQESQPLSQYPPSSQYTASSSPPRLSRSPVQMSDPYSYLDAPSSSYSYSLNAYSHAPYEVPSSSPVPDSRTADLYSYRDKYSYAYAYALDQYHDMREEEERKREDEESRRYQYSRAYA